MPMLIVFVALFATVAAGAELPSRNAKPPTGKPSRCEIGGKPGILAADGQTCIRISGYVSGQGTLGNWV